MIINQNKLVLLTAASSFVNLLPIMAAETNPIINSQENKRPNIIFLLTDDQRFDAAGFAGSKIVQTPNMDILANKGVILRNAFATTPISAASRASLLTGMYERSHQFNFKTPPLSKELTDNSYPALLKKAGYYTGYIAKMGVVFEDKTYTKKNFDYYNEYMGNFYWRAVNNMTTLRHVTDIDGDNATDFIRNSPKNKPFFLCVGFNAPHAEDHSPQQYIWSPSSDSLYNKTVIPPPFMGEQEWFEKLPVYVREGFNRVRWKWRFETPEHYQQMVKGYFRMISDIDNQIGRIMATLKEQGVADNTIIVLMGDNGYFLGERGLADKWLMYEQSIRIPMFIYNPTDSRYNQKEINKLALNIDIPPTILALAGINKPQQMQGESLTKLIEEPQTNWRTEYTCEHLCNWEGLPKSEGIRTEKWKYFRYLPDTLTEELYNLETDPYEKVNLINDKKFAKIAATMREKSQVRIKELVSKQVQKK